MDISTLDSTKLDALGEIHNITMGSAAVAISNIIDAPVWITTPQLSLCKAGEMLPKMLGQYSENEGFNDDDKYVYVKISYVEGIKGSSLLVLHQNDVQMIVNKMMGMPMEVTPDFEFDEIRISAICEVMNQMMGASATSLSQLLNTVVDISPPEAEVSSDSRTLLRMQNVSADDEICAIAFDLTIDNIVKSRFITMLSIELANSMADKLFDVNMGGTSPDAETNSTSNDSANTITTEKADAIGELENMTMGSAATALSKLLDSKVWITTPSVEVSKANEVEFEELEPSVCVRIQYTKGIYGTSILVLKQSDVQIMINKIMGLPPVATDDFVFDEMAMSAVCEIMNQMMGSSATTLAEIINVPVDISTPEVITLDNDADIYSLNNINIDDNVCIVSFDLNIDGMINSRFITMLSIDLANEMAAKMLETYSSALESYSEETTESVELNKAAPVVSPSEVLYNGPDVSMMTPSQTLGKASSADNTPTAGTLYANSGQDYAPTGGVLYENSGQSQGGYSSSSLSFDKPSSAPSPRSVMSGGQGGGSSRVNNVKVQEYQMNSFDEGEQDVRNKLTQKQYDNLLSLLNVPMDVTIRIGSTQKRMEEVLDFTKGTIIELDALANEPVDVVVNGNLIAKGDVVVVDDNFAIRITEVIKSNLLDTLS